MERLAKTSGDTYRVVVDHFAAQQERSVRFAQEVLDGAVREVWRQAESNRSLTQEELVERAEQQRGAYRTPTGRWWSSRWTRTWISCTPRTPTTSRA